MVPEIMLPYYYLKPLLVPERPPGWAEGKTKTRESCNLTQGDRNGNSPTKK